MKFVGILRKAACCMALAGILLAIVVAGCSDRYDETGTTDSQFPIRFQGSIKQECVTRADDGGFADGDCMGVFVVDYVNGKPGALKGSGNRATNFALNYQAASDSWEGNTEIYWKDEVTPIDVYGYYPFRNGITEVEAYPLAVATDQSVAHKGEMSAYEQSDFLWAKATKVTPADKTVRLDYKHRMAGVKVLLQKGEGFANEEWEKLPRLVVLPHTVPNATVNLSTGVVTASGSQTASIVMVAQANDTYRAVVVPQSVTAEKPIVTVNIDGIAYALKRADGMTYTSGKLHTFTITVNKRSDESGYQLAISHEEITAWENDELSHNFNLSAYVVVHVEEEGTLEACLAKRGTDFKELKNLKITGRLTGEDFEFIRNKLPYLAALNLREVNIVHALVSGYGGEKEEYSDNAMPSNALYGHQSLRTLILPQNLERIGPQAFRELQITKQLVIPNSVKRIDNDAFSFCPEVNLELVLPDSLEYIGDHAFYHSQFKCEFKMPNTVRHIGDAAFAGARNFYGTFRLPDKLEFLGSGYYANEGPFAGLGHDMRGEIVIPSSITEIPSGAFAGIGFANGTKLVLHDGVTKIGVGAFANLNFAAPIDFPASLMVVDQGAFADCKIPGNLNLPENLSVLGIKSFGTLANVIETTGLSGELTIPSKISVLPRDAFRGQCFTSVNLPDHVTTLGNGALLSLQFVRTIRIGKFMDYIGSEALAYCPNLQTLICLNPEPPKVCDNSFAGIYFDKAILEVPEASVELYRRTPVWNQFLNITAHKELAFNIPEVTCLQAGITQTGVVRSESEWEVTECPDWCVVSPMQGGVYGREEVTVSVKSMAQGNGNREGRIVFRLKGSDYTTYTTVTQYDYEYAEDQEIVLQEAKAGGREIPLFLVGDGYDAASIADGTYLNQLKEQMEHFFNIEPYRTYRDYFTVFTSIAVSPQKGIQLSGSLLQTNKFNTLLDDEGLHTDAEQVKNYAQKVSRRAEDLSRLTVLVLCNQLAFQSTTERDYSGCNISLCCHSGDSYPYDQRGLIQYELGGVNFGDLGNETVHHFDFIRGCTCPSCNALWEFYAAKDRGGFANLSMTGSINSVPWKHLIFHPRYSAFVDVYEGGYNHQRGVFRSEVKSCMNSYIPYYNTISRETIVRRILQLAGEEFDFEKFVEKDKLDGRPEAGDE